MDTATPCPACDAEWTNGQTCTDHFHLMCAWELENQLYDVHHLMVLCYYLQHPHLYSPAGLDGAKQQLVDFLEGGTTPQAMRKRISSAVDSGTRTYKIKGTPDSYGAYAQPVHWQVRAGDVVLAGMDNYYASVRRWADSVLKSLRQSGNLE